jgi:hypothetical protein
MSAKPKVTKTKTALKQETYKISEERWHTKATVGDSHGHSGIFQGDFPSSTTEVLKRPGHQSRLCQPASPSSIRASKQGAATRTTALAN